MSTLKKEEQESQTIEENKDEKEEVKEVKEIKEDKIPIEVPEEDKKPKKKYQGRKDGRRNKKSIFHIVINTNKPFMKYGDELKKADEKLIQAVKKLFFDARNYEKILKINPNKNKKYIDDKCNSHFIKKIKVNEYCTEISEKYHRLHCHLMLTIHHISLVHINQGFLTDYFKKVLNLDGVYVHVKSVGSGIYNLKEYISGNKAKDD